MSKFKNLSPTLVQIDGCTHTPGYDSSPALEDDIFINFSGDIDYLDDIHYLDSINMMAEDITAIDRNPKIMGNHFQLLSQYFPAAVYLENLETDTIHGCLAYHLVPPAILAISDVSEAVNLNLLTEKASSIAESLRMCKWRWNYFELVTRQDCNKDNIFRVLERIDQIQSTWSQLRMDELTPSCLLRASFILGDREIDIVPALVPIVVYILHNLNEVTLSEDYFSLLGKIRESEGWCLR